MVLSRCLLTDSLHYDACTASQYLTINAPATFPSSAIPLTSWAFPQEVKILWSCRCLRSRARRTRARGPLDSGRRDAIAGVAYHTRQRVPGHIACVNESGRIRVGKNKEEHAFILNPLRHSHGEQSPPTRRLTARSAMK